MLNEYGKSLFKPWLSVQNVVLVLAAIYLSLLIIRIYDLNKGEVASWVQALGAIVSIWAAWSIARTQGRRAALESRRNELARCAGIIGILKHIHLTIESSVGDINRSIDSSAIGANVSALIGTLDRLDLMLLPSAIFVEAICDARQRLETVQNELKAAGVYRGMLGYQFKTSVVRPFCNQVIKRIGQCEEDLSRIKSEPVL